MNRSHCIASLAIMLLFSRQAAAQGGASQEHDKEALAKQLSNPVADLVSIPFQFNWENGVGPEDGLRHILNIQPVVPFHLNDRWTLIARWIMPYVSQPILAPGGDPASGFGDITASAFFSPAGSGEWTWGVGPAMGLPVNSNPVLGSDKWSLGPTAVVLKQQGPWTYGALANHLWSFADASDAERPDVNQTFIQPFFAYTTRSAATFTLQSESSANWGAESGEEWTVPINVILTKVTHLGPFPMSIGGGGGVFVEKPEGGPEWKLRTVFTVILPAKK